MSTTARAWVWGGIAVLVVLFGIWWWYEAHPTTAMSPVAYGAPVASSTDALQSPTTPVVAQNRTSSSVVSIVDSLTNDTRFAGLLSQTGVASLLTGKGPYTVFVPMDAAFSNLPAGTINNLTAAQLKRLVEYHIISGKAIDVNAETAGVVTALSKDPLNFSLLTSDKSARVNSSAVIYAYKASNGIVYVINNVLIPPQASTQ